MTGAQGDEVSSGEDLSTVTDGVLLGISPERLSAAVGSTSSTNANRSSIARRFVAALNSDDDEEERASDRDRAAKRRVGRRARRPTPTTAAMANLVSRQRPL